MFDSTRFNQNKRNDGLLSELQQESSQSSDIVNSRLKSFITVRF